MRGEHYRQKRREGGQSIGPGLVLDQKVVVVVSLDSPTKIQFSFYFIAGAMHPKTLRP